ncbi:pullulanase-type alpha-1,6-glucosidase [Pseudokineococcus lusitanus]|uniref:Pullulanase-type alpha-1,6-glucosidase n=1 Tax=Pseudokineococcus lusitanus TaxID=763993 RepID=A0A3N1G9T5_9ACTN|nr:pullulanase-type alpha-1,6-glucosidase [Pseudokineococcus lusitanus]ROP26996.1 pullulanase-type alpha-1,6-glucosidase [Pseudokineococcus lusitanus]
MPRPSPLPPARRRRPAALAVTSAVSLAAALLVPSAAPALAHHTPTPSVVTLVGSLQDELGCPGDWQPDCAATALLPVDGRPGVFGATFDVPAGSYETKVALGGSWTENYGAGGAAGGANIGLQAPGGAVTFTYDHATHLLTDDLPDAVGGQQAAHWLSRDVVAWDTAPLADAASFRLYAARDGGLALADGAVTGATSSYPLRRTGDALPADLAATSPHLARLDPLTLPRSTRARVGDLLQGQLLVAALDGAGRVVATSGVQVPRVLDEVYAGAADRRLGLTWQRGHRPRFDLWAPTARSVTLHVYEDGSGGEPLASTTATRNRDGVWTARGPRTWEGRYYLYEVEVFVPETGRVERNLVTDPYSVGLSTNSERSLVVDLDAPALAPEGWDDVAPPRPLRPEELSVWELHVRDFSITDETVPAGHRGTYKAFTDAGSDGMEHLRGLADAGMRAVHLLPVNDIATIEEDASLRREPTCDLAALPPDSPGQQECVLATAGEDGFNWGYDPLHYTVPEGSYSTDPEGATRIREFREMVAALHGTGLGVVQDVVYNHTSSAGQGGENNLDRVVPGYYHRLDPTSGAVETSTCCPNTATEHTMMGKLVVDSLVTLVRTYRLDGIRFDLMGHHPKANILEVRAALDALTVEEDGVDGSSVYLYGEGWDFGEVAGDARFEQATQVNMAGTGIGTFNDRLRDAVRGGGPFDEDPRVQGFASGLLTDPNGAEANGTEEQQRERLLLAQDQVRVGMTGNLRDYRFTDRTGAEVTGADVDYGGSPTGYTADPQEAVTYVEAHDNETLYDALALKLPQGTPMADRVRMQTLALATTAYGQGVSFWHAGGEQLRSKSLDRNSYDSGDWFNVLDHTGTTNGFARGLPPAPDNEDKWPFMQPLLADPALRPTPADIADARAQADALLQVRASTPLFSLGTAERVQQKLSFPGSGAGQAAGVVTLLVDDTVGEDVDPDLGGLVVVLNATPDAVTQEVPRVAGDWELHPVLAGGADEVVKGATADGDVLTVPARTAAVFVAR